MSYGKICVFGPITIASAATSSSIWTMPKSFSEMLLEIPTMASAGEIYVQGSTDGTNFRRIVLPVANSSTIGTNTFVVASTATNRMVQLPFKGLPYMKLEITTAPATTASFNLICSD